MLYIGLVIAAVQAYLGESSEEKSSAHKKVCVCRVHGHAYQLHDRQGPHMRHLVVGVYRTGALRRLSGSSHGSSTSTTASSHALTQVAATLIAVWHRRPRRRRPLAASTSTAATAAAFISVAARRHQRVSLPRRL